MFLRNIQLKADNRLFSLNLKQDLAVGVLLVIYIHFLHVWPTHIVDMLVIEESQENIEIMRRHQAHQRSLGYYENAMPMKYKHWNNAPTTTAVGHRGASNCGGKM